MKAQHPSPMPAATASEGRSESSSSGSSSYYSHFSAAGRSLQTPSQNSLRSKETNLCWHGRKIAKLVVVRPGGDLVLAMPYRHRQVVRHVSLPPAVLEFARLAGARRWIVRIDKEEACYVLPLTEVERRGWLKRHRDGWHEWFLPLDAFTRCAWTDWSFVGDDDHIELSTKFEQQREQQREQRAKQLSLFAFVTAAAPAAAGRSGGTGAGGAGGER